MKNLLKVYLKKVVSDLHSAILGLFVVALMGLGGIWVFSKKLWILLKSKVGMHFTQPTTWCSMRLWRSQDTLLLASIILKHSKRLMSGLVATMPALIISLNFDGREASVAPAVGTLRRNHL